MKIRNGFVSNSSTTNFCLYGIYLKNDEVLEIAKNLKLVDSNQKVLKEAYEIMDKIVRKYKLLNYQSDSAEDSFCIGRKPDSLEDDETGKEFKEKTKKVLDEITQKNTEPYFITDGWFDG